MTITTRPATPEELIVASTSKGNGQLRRVLYRHFVRETYNPRAANGVSHREYSRARLQIVNGVPCVQYQGKLEPVRATHITTESGVEMVALIVIDSPYL